MLALQKKDARQTTRLSNNGDYAHPEEPIQVVLARDEEMGLEDDRDDEEKDPPPPPPAAIAHRLSQRIDPNLLRWQRAEAVPRLPEITQVRPANRPPSYVFDGVERF
ncbi:hypothetical protein MMC27_006200 [Xylographa pallens]|nr:hypothetical protein [Xylographa pallens]